MEENTLSTSIQRLPVLLFDENAEDELKSNKLKDIKTNFHELYAIILGKFTLKAQNKEDLLSLIREINILITNEKFLESFNIFKLFSKKILILKSENTDITQKTDKILIEFLSIIEIVNGKQQSNRCKQDIEREDKKMVLPNEQSDEATIEFISLHFKKATIQKKQAKDKKSTTRKINQPMLVDIYRKKLEQQPQNLNWSTTFSYAINLNNPPIPKHKKPPKEDNPYEKIGPFTSIFKP
jgi:hypothetical protein